MTSNSAFGDIRTTGLAPLPGDRDTKTVAIRQAERTIEVASERTILDAALEQGISYPHGCRSGRCGSCKSRLLAGDVDLLPHTPFALPPDERAHGLILACRAVPLSDLQVSWLGKGEETADHPVRCFKARVVRLEDATHDIKRIRLAPGDGEPLMFTAGQYARLTVPGAPTRDYSMANVPSESELEFHVRRVPGGAASETIFAQLALGDEVEVHGPFGDAFLRERHTGPIAAIAGGSGLAPIKSIVATALANGLRQPIHLYFGVRMARDLYLTDYFRWAAAQFSNLSFTPVLLHETGEVPYRTGLVADAVAADFDDLDGWKAYMAGPPAMIDAAGPLLAARGLRRDDTHADVFFTPEAPG